MERVAVEARVIEVVRGEYDAPTVRVAIGGSSCDSPFIFGRRGFIVGELVTPGEGQARYDTAMADRPEYLRFQWPFNEPVFDAITETRDGRAFRVAGLRPISGISEAIGDYDGDGRSDDVLFFEDTEGALVIGVRLSSRDQVLRIWSGDLPSLPHFAVRTTEPGTYTTMRHLYADRSNIPHAISLTHDGVIVVALEGPAEYLYYWEGGEFQNVIIGE